MHTQKILTLTLQHLFLIAVVLLGLGLAMVLSVFEPARVGAAAAPTDTCVDPKSEEDADKAVDPECAKPGQVNLTKDDAKKAGLDSSKNADNIVKQTLNGVYTIVSIIAVLMIVLAGIRITTADGDSNKVAAARQTIIYAVVGLAIVGSAFIITGIVQGIGTK